MIRPSANALHSINKLVYVICSAGFGNGIQWSESYPRLTQIHRMTLGFDEPDPRAEHVMVGVSNLTL